MTMDSATETVRARLQECMGLLQQQRFCEAEALLRAALRLDENNAEIAFQLGNTLARLGRLQEAVDQFRRSIASRPEFAPAHSNLGSALRDLGELSAALSAFEAAIRLRPDAVIPISNAGLLMHDLGRSDEAERLLRHGLAVDASHATLHLNLGIVLKDTGDAAGAVESLRTACALAPTNARAHSTLVYTLSFVAADPAVILTEAKRWQQRHGGVANASAMPRSRPKSTGERVRVGYLSPDFRDHCQSLFMLPLLSHHDRGAFEIICYSLVRRPDEATQIIRRHAEHWRDVANCDDTALAERIRIDRLDILVDLTMHMSGGRPLALARKPAPLQIAWLAYPGTTGMEATDYRISDPRLDPDGTDDCYTERTLRLPDTFWCYDSLTSEPMPNEAPVLANGYLTFGCLNNPCKLTDATFKLWVPIFDALPQARLLLLGPAGSARERIRSRLVRAGIDSDRLLFVGQQSRSQYLRCYHQVDLCLDTLPYNGHTTSLDAFWMGVPVVTRVGNTCAGRAGLSQLHNLGLTEFAAGTDAAFTDIVLALAGDVSRLVSLRGQLRDRLRQSPLMDAPRFARNLESLYCRVLGAPNDAR